MIMQNRLPRLDLMIAYSCNISCRGCISLSDFKRNGVAPYNDIVEWVEYWSQHINPTVITLFGGEPLLHPRILDICQLVRNNWPTSTIRLITNGYLLDTVEPNSWFDYGPFEIQVSIHRADHEHLINGHIKNILLCRTGWSATKPNDELGHEKISWAIDNFRIYKSWFKDFVVPFKDDIQPWMSNPADAHSICGAPNTPVLYKGKLYKCPAVANSMDLAGKNWFNYEPCETVDTVDTLIKNIGKPESVCGQCPDKNQAVIINHFDIKNVKLKSKNLN